MAAILQTEIYVRKPTKDRKGFAVLKRIGRNTPAQKTITVRDEKIEATNEAYLKGDLTFHEAHAALLKYCHALSEKISPKREISLHPGNMRILKRYWRDVYGQRELADERSGYTRLLRAVKALGKLSLTSATAIQIANALKEFQPDLNKRKVLYSALTQLMKYVGRKDFEIPRIKKTRRPIKYLTLDELNRVIPHLSTPMALLVRVFFATGCRPGELFSMRREYLDTQSIWVEWQTKRDLTETETKTRQGRHVIIVPELRNYLDEWLNMPTQERLTLRNIRHSQHFSKAVRKAFPDKRLVFYDLRHSYALHALKKMVPIELVAQSLGNSVQVCQEHYLGFVLNKPSVSLMAKLMAQ